MQQPAAQPEQAINIDQVLGSKVVNANGDEVGEIEDLVLDQNQTHYAVLSVGGFLGIDDKKVAIPLEDLQLGEDEAYLMSSTTEEQLEGCRSTTRSSSSRTRSGSVPAAPGS